MNMMKCRWHTKRGWVYLYPVVKDHHLKLEVEMSVDRLIVLGPRSFFSVIEQKEKNSNFLPFTLLEKIWPGNNEVPNLSLMFDGTLRPSL